MNAPLLEGRAKISVVVYLTVINDAQTGLIVPHWLVPGCQINNAQPSHGEAELFPDPIALIIRPTVRQSRVHSLDDALHLFALKVSAYADYATHKRSCGLNALLVISKPDDRNSLF